MWGGFSHRLYDTTLTHTHSLCTGGGAGGGIDGGAGGSTGGDDGEEEEEEEEDDGDDDHDDEEEHWTTVGCDASHGPKIKLDMLHASQRIRRMLSQKHGAFPVFVARLRDALMPVVKEDLQALKCRMLAQGLTEEEWEGQYERKQTVLIRHCRRIISGPAKLLPRMEALGAIYANIPDARTRLPLFSKKAWDACLTLLWTRSLFTPRGVSERMEVWCWFVPAGPMDWRDTTRRWREWRAGRTWARSLRRV